MSNTKAMRELMGVLQDALKEIERCLRMSVSVTMFPDGSGFIRHDTDFSEEQLEKMVSKFGSEAREFAIPEIKLVSWDSLEEGVIAIRDFQTTLKALYS